jgi:hydroxymethyl cephem carbamoyltransferase
MFRDLGHFSSVFVPPCPNDSGLAIGAAAEALRLCTGDAYIDWDVYGGLEFEPDVHPDPDAWLRRPVRDTDVADALADGRIFGWAQGRAEIGPRALGNRSLLADPSSPRTRDRLNEIKQREGYRPIAPVCRVEDLGKYFDSDFEDPYMLYFRMVTSDRLGAVTHVDGTARCQTVSRESNRRLHELLSAVADRTGVGVLCNTSLNFKGLGFINKTSDLVKYADATGLDDFVVGDAWYERVRR